MAPRPQRPVSLAQAAFQGGELAYSPDYRRCDARHWLRAPGRPNGLDLSIAFLLRLAPLYPGDVHDVQRPACRGGGATSSATAGDIEVWPRAHWASIVRYVDGKDVDVVRVSPLAMVRSLGTHLFSASHVGSWVYTMPASCRQAGVHLRRTDCHDPDRRSRGAFGDGRVFGGVGHLARA